jgi:hypothetical protein
MENEILKIDAARRADALTRSKLRAVSRLTRSRHSIMDFGAGSGTFLWFCRPLFHTVEGVEITPRCIAFAKDSLGVNLRPSIRKDGRYGVVTAWHSLEHLPPASLKNVVGQLYSVTTEAIVISVPNAGSWAAALFKGYFPFHDATTHYHQFTAKSIQLLLKNAGWRNRCWFRMGIYSLFCHAQGFVNCATQTHNLLYFRWKRQQPGSPLSAAGMLLHVSLLAVFTPLALLLTLVEYAFPEHAACLNVVCYKDHTSSPRTDAALRRLQADTRGPTFSGMTQSEGDGHD